MKKKSVTMMDIFQNPRYRGKHIILAAGKIYTSPTGEGAAEILRRVRKNFPDVTPEVAYLPKARIGLFERLVPLAFFERNEVPPLLGRLGFLETFTIEFLKSHQLIFKN